jgi:hypothetical protein
LVLWRLLVLVYSPVYPIGSIDYVG